jgi:hypothetical protein
MNFNNNNDIREMNELRQSQQDVRNGIVNIMDSGPVKQYDLFQENSNGTSNFQNEALKGIQAASPLSMAFFSKRNLDNVQTKLKYNVWIQSNKKFVIGRQSDTELQTVMKSIYLQYARNLPTQIKEQVDRLNGMVLDYCTPNVISAVEQYHHYRKDISQLPQPLEHAKNMSNSGSKTLPMYRFF